MVGSTVPTSGERHKQVFYKRSWFIPVALLLLAGLLSFWGMKGFPVPWNTSTGTEERTASVPAPIASAPSRVTVTTTVTAQPPASATSGSEAAFPPGVPLPRGVSSAPAVKTVGQNAASAPKSVQTAAAPTRKPKSDKVRPNPNKASRVVKAPAQTPMAVPPPPMVSVPEAVAPAAPEARLQMPAFEPDYLDRITLWSDTVPTIAYFNRVDDKVRYWTVVGGDPCTPPICTLELALGRTNWPAYVQAWFLWAERTIPAPVIMIAPGTHRRPMWATWGKNVFTFESNVVAAWPDRKPQPATHWWVTVGSRSDGRPKTATVFHVAKVHACGNYVGWVEEASVPPAPQVAKLTPGPMPLSAFPPGNCPD